MSKVIAICNHKGGVGKTTTSINLGIGLVRKGKKVLLIDFDPQANATIGLGYDPGEVEVTIGDILSKIIYKESDIDVDAAVLHHKEGIDLMPADLNLSCLEMQINSLSFGRERVLYRFVQQVRKEYDFILIDCMPSVGIFTINALVAADELIIPLNAEKYSVRALGNMFNIIQSVIDDGMNDHLKIAGLLFTIVNDRTVSFKEIYAMVQEAYGKNITIFDSYIPESVKARDMTSYGCSIYEYAPRCNVAVAYDKFTEEFVKKGEA